MWRVQLILGASASQGRAEGTTSGRRAGDDSFVPFPPRPCAVRSLLSLAGASFTNWRDSFTLVAGAALAGVYQDAERDMRENRTLDGRATGSICDGQRKEVIPRRAVLQTVTTLEQETPVFCFLDDWLLRYLLEDVDARAAMAHRFANGYGRAETCPGLDDCIVPLYERECSHADAHVLRCRHGLRFHLWFFDQRDALRYEQTDGFYAFAQTLGLFALDDVEGRETTWYGLDMEDVSFLNGAEVVERMSDPGPMYSIG